jgi:hypothetical protein
MTFFAWRASCAQREPVSGILFKSAQFVIFELKIHLTQPGPAGPSHWETAVVQNHAFGLFNQRLSPH